MIPRSRDPVIPHSFRLLLVTVLRNINWKKLFILQGIKVGMQSSPKILSSVGQRACGRPLAVFSKGSNQLSARILREEKSRAIKNEKNV